MKVVFDDTPAAPPTAAATESTSRTRPTPGTVPCSSASPASDATPVTVPIVSKKSVSMIAKIVSAAVSGPRTVNTLVRSNWPIVAKLGVAVMVDGTVATPVTRQTTVMTAIEMIRAPRSFMTHRTIVRSSPSRKMNCDVSVGKTGATIGDPPCGVTMKPPLTKPMNRMNRPMPTPIARLSDSGTACMTASRKPTTTSSVTSRPSRTMTPIAPWGVKPRAVSPKATIALMPRPAAMASG